MKYIYYLFFVKLLMACGGKDSETSLFVGAYKTLDRVIPYPFLLEQKKDSMFFYDYKGFLLDRKFQKEIKNKDTLVIGGKKFLILKKNIEKVVVFDLLDTVNYPVYKNKRPVIKFGATLVASENTIISKKVSQIEESLEKVIWSYKVIEDENDNPNEDFRIEKLYFFSDNILTELTTYYYEEEKIISEHQSLKYNVFQISDKTFLSFSKKEDNPQPVFQVLKSNNSEIQLKDFSSFAQKEKKITFYKKGIDKEDFKILLSGSDVYENCFDGFQGQYYHTSSDVYSKGNEYVLNHVKMNAPDQNGHENGYIILHFNINCHQKIGDFGLIQMTRGFEKTVFSLALIKHITAKVRSLEDWPIVLSERGSYKDEHAFLMFKIENGKIIDVCP